MFDRRESVFGTEADMNLSALQIGRKIFNTRRGGVDFKAAALARSGECVARRVRWRIGRDDFNRVSAVGQEAGIKGVRLVADVILQQQPATLSVTAIVDGVHELIVVVVVRAPLYADGIVVTSAG